MYTNSDYRTIEKALNDMIKLKKYFDELINKLEIEREILDDDGILDSIYHCVRHQNAFDINNYEENKYIDIAYDNLVLSIYTTEDGNVFIGEGFEVWNDEEGYCIGVFSIAQMKDILKLRGNK